jgi:hypothetical protein
VNLQFVIGDPRHIAPSEERIVCGAGTGEVVVIHEHRGPDRSRRGGDDPPILVEELRDTLVLILQCDLGRDVVTAAVHEPRQRLRPHPKVVFELLLQRGLDADIEEHAERSEHDRHRNGERQCETDADREPAHSYSLVRSR